jgi:integrase
MIDPISHLERTISAAPGNGNALRLVPAPDAGNAFEDYLASLPSPNSRKSMRSSLVVCLRTLLGRPATWEESAAFNWASLDAGQLAALRSELAGAKLSGSSVNRALACLRGVLRSHWRRGEIDSDQYRQRWDALRMVPVDPTLLGRMVRFSELQAIFKTDDGDASLNARDHAVIAVMYGCGLRREEVCKLTLDDVTPDGLKVNGKGRRKRTVPMNQLVLEKLNAWLLVRGQGIGPLFVPVGRRHKGSTNQLHVNSIMDICKRRCWLARLHPFTPHDLRRTFCSTLLEREVDVSTVSKLMGHAHVAMTGRYDRRPALQMRKAVAELPDPRPMWQHGEAEDLRSNGAD